jgi:transcriptional regulator with XRE-family HTH domain
VPTDLDKAVGARIRARRTEMSLSLARLADLSNGRFKASLLGGYERGERALTVTNLVDLADVLDVSPTHLLPIEHGGRPSRATITIALEGDDVTDLVAVIDAARTDDNDPIPYVTTEVA